MSIRYGTSWPGRQPGVRHWRSSSMGLWFGWLGLGLLGGAFLHLVLWSFMLAPMWLSIEFYVLGISGLIVLARWGLQPVTRFSVQFRRAWGFWYLSA